MTPKDIALVALVSGLLTAAWILVAKYRSLRPRLWAILARKPHRTRRAYHLRFVLCSIEDMELFAPRMTVAIGAMLFALYIADTQGWPDLVLITLFLAPGVLGFASYFIKLRRLVHRVGLLCPACKSWLTHRTYGKLVLKSGRCQTCSATLFRVPGRSA